MKKNNLIIVRCVFASFLLLSMALLGVTLFEDDIAQTYCRNVTCMQDIFYILRYVGSALFMTSLIAFAMSLCCCVGTPIDKPEDNINMNVYTSNSYPLSPFDIAYSQYNYQKPEAPEQPLIDPEHKVNVNDATVVL